MDVEKFVRHLCRLVLRHQMPVWNYFVNSFYSARTLVKLNYVILSLHSFLILSSCEALILGLSFVASPPPPLLMVWG
jgi:hypothetical protein